MATSKSAKIQAEMEKVKAKISEAQAKLKESEQQHREEIVDIVRGMSDPLDELPLLLQKLRGASGQSGQKSAPDGKEATE